MFFKAGGKRVVGRTETALDGIGLIHRPAKTHRQLTAVALDRTPHFDAAGRFIHPCSNCGREAVIGTHVNVLAGQLGSLARVKLGKQGLQTIPFTFEDEMIEAIGKGELDVALVTPATISYYYLLHKDSPVTLVRDYESMPELRWEVAVGMSKADDALVAAVNTALNRMLVGRLTR
jgi:ABC-type amino acid transport substrate-binding protein